MSQASPTASPPPSFASGVLNRQRARLAAAGPAPAPSAAFNRLDGESLSSLLAGVGSYAINERLKEKAEMAKPATRVLLHVFPSFEVGGQQARFVQLANHFARTEPTAYRHAVFAMNGDYASELKLNGKVDYLRLPTPPLRRGFPFCVSEYRKVLRQLQPDLLVTYNWGSIEWAMANARPLCPQLHFEDGFGPEEVEGQLARRVWTRRLVLSRHARVIYPSLGIGKIAREQWRLPEERLLYVPNGVDCERFDTSGDPRLAARLGLPSGTPLIGTVAALRKEKNLHRLIEAFAGLRSHIQSHLVLIGEGPERAALAAHVAEKRLGEHVTFTGRMEHPEKILGLLDLYASSSDTEQMPLGVLEAMAAGKAVVATDVGDIRSMVCADNRPFVSGVSASALTKHFRLLLEDGLMRRAIGLQNRERARATYSQTTMFDTYRKLFG